MIPYPTLKRLRLWGLSLFAVAASACSVDYGEDSIQVYVRSTEVLNPYSYVDWNIEYGQRVVFGLKDYHEWVTGGSSHTYYDYAIRGTELKYWIYLEDHDARGPLSFQLDVVAYDDTVHTEMFSLEDDGTFPEPGRPHYHSGSFVWE